MITSETRLLELTDDGRLTMPAARLVVLRGPDRGRALHLEQEEVLIGTSPATHLRLTDPTVSRHHLSLRAEQAGYLVTDLDSKNGTLLGGHRVKAAYAAPGDQIEVGTTRLRLEAVRGQVELKLSRADRFGPLIGRSVAARRLFGLLETVAREDVTVLLLGETGTGKDAAAEAIHQASARADGPFVVVDCGALPAGLVESELFGHEKGAFTGADQRRVGAFEEAHRGTLFLDEIGELPREAQAKLLRALERRGEARAASPREGAVAPLMVRRVGGAVVPVDVRIVAATNRDLRRDVNHGQFREDLYYRLAVVTVQVPPLRERLEDIPLLAEHFRRALTGDAEGRLPDKQVAAFLEHAWPGNVRELKNQVERAVSLPEAAELEPPRELEPFRRAKERAVAEFERGYLQRVLREAKGNASEASRLAGMDRVHLSRLLRKHQVPRG